MAKLKLLLFIFLGIIILILFGTILFFLLKPKVAGIYVDTNPASEVAINGERKGKTPYKALLQPGEVVLQLYPEGESSGAYETKVTLLPGVETVVRQTFGKGYDTTSGEIISFEKIGKGETSLTIVTIPDGADVVIDGTIKGIAPYKTSVIDDGEHTVLVSAKGYTERSVKVKTHEGYKLTAIVTLAKGESPVVSSTPTPSATPIPEAIIEILTTPTGTLRVRKEPKTASEEVGEVSTGDSYPLVERDTVTGWFKIRLTDGQEGWVSPQYTKRIQNPNFTPTVTSTVTPRPTAQSASSSATPTRRTTPSPTITVTPIIDG